MPDALPPLIRKLLDPAFSPLVATPAELVETHASWVLLAGEFAWKFKKPVVLPFLDYGTLARRRYCCAEELRLNRRFAPALYLDVVEFDGEPAVKMHRFDEAGRLDHVCRRGELRPEHLSGLAATLARFHAAAAVAPANSRFGTIAAVLDSALENFTELRALTRGIFSAELDRLDAWTRREFARLETDSPEPIFTARRAGGHIRECHGDLHLGNLVLLNGQVTLFDCIEFNDDFRWIDVASEIAFTLVDLLDHGQPGLACWLLNEWLVETGDFDAVEVLRFYMVYRALVRAKVAAIRAGQQDAGVGGNADLYPAVREYLALAQSLAVPLAPTFCITHGVAGAGKSTAARQRLLADPWATTLRLRADVERKRLFGLAPGASSHSARDAGIYTPAANVRTYARLAELAGNLLDAGWSVIVDAAFLKRAERDAFHALATARGRPFSIIACTAPADELRRRVAAWKASWAGSNRWPGTN